MKAGIAFCLVLTGPAAAQSAFEPYLGCSAPFVTIQRADCRVDQLVICAADLPGEHRRATYDADGLHSRHHHGPDYQWIESRWENGLGTHWLLDDPADPADLSRLLASGFETFDFLVATDAGDVIRYYGEHRLTGEKAFVDGVAFFRTEITIVAERPPGTETWRAMGGEFVNEAWRTFHGGRYIETSAGADVMTDRSPLEVFFPGDPGFVSVVPRYGCDDVIISELID